MQRGKTHSEPHYEIAEGQGKEAGMWADLLRFCYYYSLEWKSRVCAEILE